MTLAIAVRYPYGRLRAAFESLSMIRPLKWQKAVIFLTDSRWTYPNHYEDDGVKLHDIDATTVIAYSGRVNIAEHCISNLKSKINNPRIKVINIQDTFRRVYYFHNRQNDKNRIETGKLSFLIGKYYLKTDDTSIFLLESPDFKHKLVTDIEGIGWLDAYEEVKKIVVQKLEDLSNFNGTKKDYFNVAVIITDAMRTLAIDNPNYKTIGGLVQCWVLDRDGITEQKLSYTEDPTGEKDQWHRATAERSELKTLKDKYDLGDDYLM